MPAKQLVIIAVALSAVLAVDYYHSIEDDYDATNASVEDTAAIFDCLSDSAPCTGLGAQFRQFYPEIIIQACARCTPPQRLSICRHMKRGREVVPARFQMFVDRYDPDRIYFDNFLAALGGC